MTKTHSMLILFVCLTGLAMLLLFACSDDSESSPDPTSTPTPTATVTPTPNSAPDTFITSGPEVATSFPVTITYRGEDIEDPAELLTFASRLNGSEWTSWTSSTTMVYSGLEDGDYLFEVKARDSAGLEDASPATWPFTMALSSDDQAPETWIVSGPSGTINDDEALFTFAGSDNETASSELLFSYIFDNGSWSVYSTGTEAYFSGLSDGTHYFSVRAKDEAGNVDPTPDSRTFTVQTTYYAVSLLPPTATQTVNAGDEATFRVDLTNIGTLTANYRFSLVTQIPEGWSAVFCLSDGTCIVDEVTIEFTPGATDFMTIHIYTTQNDPPGLQGRATLYANCQEDSSVSGNSVAIAVIAS